MVVTAASMAQAASTALPPLAKIIRTGGSTQRLAGDGEPVPSVKGRPLGLGLLR